MTTRRTFLKSSLAATIVTGAASLANAQNQETGNVPETKAPTPRKGRIRQSVSRWCYKSIPLDQLCQASAQMGLKAVDLLEIDEWEVPRRYGLICSMGYAGGGTIPDALNRTENHDAIEAAFRKNIPLAAKAGVPNVITFSGNRKGMSDDEGARNCVIGLNRLKKIAEDNGVNICMELLNSKHDHHDYMCDHTAWGVRVVSEVNSPRVKLLYDIYHMQIMEGDLIATIGANIQWLGHFHTGGVPGRHELDNTQEVQWDGVMRGIVGTDFTGYVAHEFVPSRDPLTSLREAVDLCDV
jgi:hydroxypyruvate isomerase